MRVSTAIFTKVKWRSSDEGTKSQANDAYVPVTIVLSRQQHGHDDVLVCRVSEAWFCAPKACLSWESLLWVSQSSSDSRKSFGIW